MRKHLLQWWKGYKYRFVPWIALNVKHKPVIQTPERSSKKDHAKLAKISVPVHHMKKSEDKPISDSELTRILIRFFMKCEDALNLQRKSGTLRRDLSDLEISALNQKVMEEHFGFTVKRSRSTVSPDAGTGVFVTSGVAKKGSVVGLYCGTLYLPSEPLFFPSLGNPFIFRCADGIHIDGNDKWISKSIYKSCAARDKYGLEIPCCDQTWLTSHSINPLNLGQYVNNRSHSHENNVVYQESLLTLKFPQRYPPIESEKESLSETEFPIMLSKYLPNIWCDPANSRGGVKVVPLVAVKDISAGEELLSSYFTVVHSEEREN